MTMTWEAVGIASHTIVLIILWRSVLWLHRDDTCISSFVRHVLSTRIPDDKLGHSRSCPTCKDERPTRKKHQTVCGCTYGTYVPLLSLLSKPSFLLIKTQQPAWMAVLVDRSPGLYELESFFQVKRIARRQWYLHGKQVLPGVHDVPIIVTCSSSKLPWEVTLILEVPRSLSTENRDEQVF